MATQQKKAKGQPNVTHDPYDYYSRTQAPKCHLCDWKGGDNFWLSKIEDALRICDDTGENPPSIKIWWRCKSCGSGMHYTTFYK